MESDRKQALLEHFRELKKRLIVCLVVFLVAAGVCYVYAPAIYQFLVAPLAENVADEGRRMIYTGLTEAFFTYLKLAVFGGLCLAFPVFAWQIYGFLKPGLYKNERGLVAPYLVAAPLMFLVGAAFCYYFIFPTAWKFFLGFETAGAGGGLPIQLEAKVSEYLSLVTHLILAFGFSFQLPVVMVLLTQTGMTKADTFARGRRYAIVGIVAVAAVITPPDLFSQIALSIPLYVLYELAIACSKLVEKRA
jgi:sec-independent protein translocase protein TatC